MNEVIPMEIINQKIFLIRREKVMVDMDLAKLYGVETKHLIQAVKRNISRFPQDFMFQLSDEEFVNLRSQNVTSSWGGRRYPPYVFTEHGVAMLSSVLKSERAIKVNIAIMRAFIRLRKMVSNYSELFRKVEAMEKKYDTQFKVVFDVIKSLIETPPPKEKLKIKLADGKEREIQHMISTSFWGADGKPISVEEFLQSLFGALPEFFKSEDELRKIWSHPLTRKTLLNKLADAGYARDELATMQKLIDAEKSDLFDVLEYVAFAVKPITREARVAGAQSNIFAMLNNKQKEFLEFVLSKYIETGVEELDEEKLPDLLTLKYHAIKDASEMLGGVENIRTTFFDFQKYLYERKLA